MISLACIFVKLIKIIFYLIVRRINSILGNIKLEIKKLQIIIPFYPILTLHNVTFRDVVTHTLPIVT